MNGFEETIAFLVGLLFIIAIPFVYNTILHEQRARRERLETLEKRQEQAEKKISLIESDLEQKKNRLDKVEHIQEAGFSEISGIVQQLLEPLRVELQFIHQAIEEVKNQGKR